MVSTESTVMRSLEQGFLVGMEGPAAGEIVALDGQGKELGEDFRWISPGRGSSSLARLRRNNGTMRLEDVRTEMRISGEPVGQHEEVPCNATLQIGESRFRVLYLSGLTNGVKAEEQEIRRPSPFQGLLPADVGISDSALRDVEDLISSFDKDSPIHQSFDGWQVQDFIAEFASDPIRTVQAQNEVIAAQQSQEKRRQAARAFLTFNALVESRLFPARRVKTPSTYDELQNVLYIAQDDYLPGHNFVLGRDETYNREKLCIDKIASEHWMEDLQERALVEFFIEARLMGSDGSLNEFEKCLRLFFRLARNFPTADPMAEQPASETLLLQDFFDVGGVCRHKCAVLQLALQEAGLHSRYLRGKLFFGGYHAWVDVDILGDGSYLLILDPHLNYIVLKTATFVSLSDRIYLREEGYPITPIFNTVWRAKPGRVKENAWAL